jgi:hypothetical protein
MFGRRAKFGNRKTVVDGITFDSKAEAARYGVLKILQAAGVVANLRLQVPYVLTVNGVKVCRYVADFVYVLDGREVVEDVKGVKTREYSLKRKLMLAVFGIEIQEIGNEGHKRKKAKSAAGDVVRGARNRKK